MVYDIRVSNKATYFSAFQWRHVYNIETNTNIQTYTLHMYWDIWGRSMSNSSRWRVWILIRFTRWTVFMRSPSSEHYNSLFFYSAPPLSLSPNLSSSGSLSIFPPHLFHLAVQVIQCLKCQLRWFHWWFWNCLTFPGLGHQFLFRIHFRWGLWGHIHLQELVYEIRLIREKTPKET